MNLRSIIGLLLVAFVGGAAALGWYAWDDIVPSGGKGVAAARPALRAAADAAPATTFLPSQPVVADSAATENMLLLMAARRDLENGKTVKDYLPRLHTAFGEAYPQVMARLSEAGEHPLSNAALLAEFDAISPLLVRPAGTGWERIKYEAATLFVLRRGDRAVSPAIARLDRVRQNLISGETETALRLVRALPGAPEAADWIAKAERAVAVNKAFDTLDQAAIGAITAPKASVPPTIPILPPATVSEEAGTAPAEAADGE